MKVYLLITSFFLILTALLKAMALWSGGVYLYTEDKLLDIQNIYILWGVMMCELVVVVLILWKPQSYGTAVGVFFLGSQFVLYRTISAIGGFAVTCPCIGNMGKAMGLSPSVENFILSFIAAWMCLGGALLLWYRPFQNSTSGILTPGE